MNAQEIRRSVTCAWPGGRLLCCRPVLLLLLLSCLLWHHWPALCRSLLRRGHLLSSVGLVAGRCGLLVVVCTGRLGVAGIHVLRL